MKLLGSMAAVTFGLPLFPMKAAPQTMSSPAIVVKHVDEMESLLQDPKISPPYKPAGVLEEKVSAQSFCIFLPYHFQCDLFAEAAAHICKAEELS